MSKTILISEYLLHKNHAGMAGVYDLHRLFLNYGASLLAYRVRPKNLLSKFTKTYHVESSAKVDIHDADVIVVCNTPKIFGILETIKSDLKLTKSVSVIFMDGFDAQTMNGFGDEVLDLVDHAFSPVLKIVDTINGHKKRCKAHHLPYGVDALSIAELAPKKTVDIYNYGRVDTKLHDFLCDSYTKKREDTYYIFSSFAGANLVDQNRHRELHWNTLLRSKVSFCFEASNVGRFFGASPVLYRWYECLAAGAVVLGTRPLDTNANDILFWENSTIETGFDLNKTEVVLNDVLDNYDQYVALTETSRRHVLTSYDLRYRVRDVYTRIGVDLPPLLTDELDKLARFAAL